MMQLCSVAGAMPVAKISGHAAIGNATIEYVDPLDEDLHDCD
ncbi:MAG: hypothetical protein WKF52_06370 [Sphingomicrobium sp.]